MAKSDSVTLPPVVPTKSNRFYARQIASAIKALNQIDRLRERASEVLSRLPNKPYMDDKAFETLRLDIPDLEADAVVRFTTISWGYGDDPSSLMTEEYQFPAWLLFCDAADLNRWRLEKWAEHNREIEANASKAEAARVDYQRRQYEALKAKFEPAS